MSRHDIKSVDVEPAELLGDSIKRISNCISDLKKTGINEKCIVDLLYLRTKVPRKTINLIFNSLDELVKVYCEDGSV